MISLICGIQKTQMDFFTEQKQAHRHRKQLWLPKERGRDKLGVWINGSTTIYKTDNQ